MKLFLLFLLSGMITAGCVSSGKNSHVKSSYSNLVKLQPPAPGQKNQKPSRVYIDSIQTIRYHKKQALLIRGSFPDGCTNLKTASMNNDRDPLALVLEAWKNPSLKCTQALISFTYIYDNPQLNELDLEKRKLIKVNGENYELR